MTNEAPITTIGLAAIVAFTTAVSTSIPLWFASRRKTKDHEEAARDKKEDWARQDAVAKEVREAKAATETVAVTLAENTKATNSKLDVIHDLVNSKMTESMQNELDSEVKGLALMKEVMALKEAAGLKPSEEAAGIIKNTDQKINELRARLGDRLKQQEAIDAKKN